MRTHLIRAITIVVLCAGTAANAKYSGGTGDTNDPYRIATPQDLNDIGNHQEDWSKNFILTNDVNLMGYTGTQFRIIGSFTKSFTGIFDGNEHAVWNFAWTSTWSKGAGLFGYIGSTGQVNNLGLENVDVNVASGDCAGGLVGSNGGTITNCYTICKVSGNETVGGLAGGNHGLITDCYSMGTISGDWPVGGLVGDNSGTINNCYSNATVLGNRYPGGLVGGNSGIISASYSTGSVSGYNDVGGLVGYSYGGTITNCYSTGSVSGNVSIGGLLGGINNCTITRCYSTSNISGKTYVGGLCGLLRYSSGIIANCYSVGNVVGEESVGGLVGDNHSGTIANCYSSTSVRGSTNYIGGLVGRDSSGTLTNCYSAGSVSGNGYVGGLIGYTFIRGSITASFWDMQTSGQSSSAGGTPKTTVEMKTKSTFTDAPAGWDFVNIWDICEATNYPRLRWQIPAADFLCPYGVGFADFAVLSSAWQTGPNDSGWDSACDISNPKDSVIDELDLAVFCENWLEEK